MRTRLICLATSAALLALSAYGQTLAPREVPAKSIPVPSTVSPQMQAIIAQPLRTNWDKPPTTPEGWKQLADSIAATVALKRAVCALEGHRVSILACRALCHASTLGEELWGRCNLCETRVAS